MILAGAASSTPGDRSKCAHVVRKIHIVHNHENLMSLEATMPIEFYCPGCGHLMRTPDETAGRKGRCPNCDIKVQIPPTTLAHLASCADFQSPDSSDDLLEAEAPKIEFSCSNCGRQVRVAESAAGQRGQCPHCQAVVRIPTDDE